RPLNNSPPAATRSFEGCAGTADAPRSTIPSDKPASRAELRSLSDTLRNPCSVRASAQGRSADPLAENHDLVCAAESARQEQRLQGQSPAQRSRVEALRAVHDVVQPKTHEEIGLIELANGVEGMLLGRPAHRAEIDVRGDIGAAGVLQIDFGGMVPEH